MDLKIILNYLSDLEKNNEREWYHIHKAEYKNADTEFKGLLQELILGIGNFDEIVLHNSPENLTFKLVRDTRFSHDKSPYNPAFRAHIGPKGKLPVPVGYYIMIKPGDRSFLGGGLFADMFKDATRIVRDYISSHPSEFHKIISAPDFTDFFKVQGTALKNVPSGYDKEHPMAEFIKNKSWYLEYPVKDAQIYNAENFVTEALSIFKRMKPFNDYLNNALAEFTMPER